jgi:hypothetical protein
MAVTWTIAPDGSTVAPFDGERLTVTSAGVPATTGAVEVIEVEVANARTVRVCGEEATEG